MSGQAKRAESICLAKNLIFFQKPLILTGHHQTYDKDRIQKMFYKIPLLIAL
jgi:hypothetical protein